MTRFVDFNLNQVVQDLTEDALRNARLEEVALHEHLFDRDAIYDIDMYIKMCISSKVDAKLLDRAKNGFLPFAIVGRGQELAQMSIAQHLKPGDAVRGYYRNGPTDITIGVYPTLESIFAQAYGDTSKMPDGNLADPSSGGRMMNNHAGSRMHDKNGKKIDQSKKVFRGSDVSSTGSQMPVARGMALASHYFKAVPEAGAKLNFNTHDDVVVVNIGDAAVAEGFVLGAINQVSVDQGLGRDVPLVIHILDNQYGIGVPKKYQVNKKWAKSLSGLGIKIIEADGNDINVSKQSYEDAVRYSREKRKPVIIISKVTQPDGHSLDGDHRRYKSKKRIKYDTEEYCLVKTRKHLLDKGYITEENLVAIEDSIQSQVDEASERAYIHYYKPVLDAIAANLPMLEAMNKSSSSDEVKSATSAILKKWTSPGTKFAMGPDVVDELENLLITVSVNEEELCSSEEYIEIKKFVETTRVVRTNNYKENIKPPYTPGQTIKPTYDEKPEVDKQSHIIAATLANLLAKDPTILIFGEDTGRPGGVKSTTRGLQEGHKGIGMKTKRGKKFIDNMVESLRRLIPKKGFGKERVFDHGIDESTIVGTAVGLALRGLFPIIEIQYLDYLVCALQQIVDEVDCLHSRTNGGQFAKMLIRTVGHRQMGMFHSGSPMHQLLGLKGMNILVPRDAVQAAAMYNHLADKDQASISIEPLEDLAKRTEVPNNVTEMNLPLGQSEILHEGSDITIITYGACCKYAVAAAQKLKKAGISAEIIDLQTLAPLDLNNVAKISVAKTGKVIMLDEDLPNTSGAMLINKLQEDGMIQCPVQHITAIESKPPYGRDGKYFGKPQAVDIYRSVCSMLGKSAYN